MTVIILNIPATTIYIKGDSFRHRFISINQRKRKIKQIDF